MHDDLLELARELAVREKGKPKQTSLRRSISTSYYAAFHALADMCARELVGWAKPWEPFVQVYRALDHQVARRIFISDRNGAVFGPRVAELGGIFVLLQANRQAADYDPQPHRFGRSETLEVVEMAKRVVEIVSELPADIRLLLAVSLITRKR